MLNTILRKKAQVLALSLVLLILLTATTAFAATKLIKAEQGGKINIDKGVKLVIPRRALAEDTVISADMIQKKRRVYFNFGPDGTSFLKPVELCISWKVMDGVKELTLYGEDG